MTQTLLRAPIEETFVHDTKIIGSRPLASDELVEVLDVNQWIAAFKKSVGMLDTCRVSTKASTRILEYALQHRRTTKGARVVIGSSVTIVNTFRFTILNSSDPKVRALAPQAILWLMDMLKRLKFQKVLFFDATPYEKGHLVQLAARPDGMPDWEDQGVFQTFLDLRASAIVGLDNEFMQAVRKNHCTWLTPGDVLSVMPS